MLWNALSTQGSPLPPELTRMSGSVDPDMCVIRWALVESRLPDLSWPDDAMCIWRWLPWGPWQILTNLDNALFDLVLGVPDRGARAPGRRVPGARPGARWSQCCRLDLGSNIKTN